VGLIQLRCGGGHELSLILRGGGGIQGIRVGAMN
jgi:hypothetical protein